MKNVITRDDLCEEMDWWNIEKLINLWEIAKICYKSKKLWIIIIFFNNFPIKVQSMSKASFNHNMCLIFYVF
jgi:hypothetical protein